MYNRLLSAITICFSFILLVGSFATLQTNTYAKIENEFSKTYGLIVHSANLNRPVSRVKVLEVILKYFGQVDNMDEAPEVGFSDVKDASHIYFYVKKGCAIKLLDCSAEEFFPHDDISQQDFLSWFFTLKYADDPDFLEEKYPAIKKEYHRNWLEARRMNFLSGKIITYQVMQDFLYRNKIAEENMNMPFRETLGVRPEDINEKNFHSLNEIKFIKNFLNVSISELQAKRKLSKDEKNYLSTLKKQLPLFKNVENRLKKSPYILRQRPDLDPKIARAVREHNLQEVLYSYSYDYSENLAYRKHNLTTGVSKMHGKVFMPGEVMNYWKVISDKNLWDFKYGWVTVGGVDEWRFGGGICGSSSLVFLPSWKAGLEILERRNHNNYYTYLYPKKDVGLDATVYRPYPNLRIKNNMESPIVFNVIDDKKNEIITLEIIGNRDYKNIRLEGPIYETKTRIKWIRHMEGFDGSIKSEELVSVYNFIR